MVHYFNIPTAVVLYFQTSAVDSLFSAQNQVFWIRPEFWISTIIGIAGLVFSVKAYLEARSAKLAATEAGKTVRIQSITIELSEISQKLERLSPDIHYDGARDMLAEISRRLRRIISPFNKDPELADAIRLLKEALVNGKTSLNSVRPIDEAKQSEAPRAVYYGIEEDWATINNCVADLLGLFEKKSIDFGDSDGEV